MDALSSSKVSLNRATHPDLGSCNRLKTNMQHIFYINNIFYALNFQASTYFSGIRKCKRDHSSLSEFWSGVPVMSSLWLDLKSIRVLYRSESSFLSRWASSTPRKAQFIFPNTPCTHKQDLAYYACNSTTQIKTKVNQILTLVIPYPSVEFHTWSKVHWTWFFLSADGSIRSHGSGQQEMVLAQDGKVRGRFCIWGLINSAWLTVFLLETSPR